MPVRVTREPLAQPFSVPADQNKEIGAARRGDERMHQQRTQCLAAFIRLGRVDALRKHVPTGAHACSPEAHDSEIVNSMSGPRNTPEAVVTAASGASGRGSQTIVREPSPDVHLTTSPAPERRASAAPRQSSMTPKASSGREANSLSLRAWPLTIIC